jgi:hypothetical protein
LNSGAQTAAQGGPHDGPAGGPVFASGTFWAAQVGSISPRGFVLLVAGMPFDIKGKAPGPTGTTLVVRAEGDEGATVFDVVPAAQPARAVEALRLALGHLLQKALDATPVEPPPTLAVQSSSALATALSSAVRERLSEPSPALADYLMRGVLRVDLPIATPDGEALWQLEIDPESSRQAGDAPHGCSVTLFAALPATGPVETRLTLAGESLSVRFVVASDAACARILTGKDELVDGLRAAGFTRVLVDAVASPAQLARDRATDTPLLDRPLSGGLIDIRA